MVSVYTNNPPLCLLLALFIDKITWAQMVLNQIGRYSFGIYLIHHEIMIIIRNINIYVDDEKINSVICFLALLLTFPCCLLLRGIINIASKIMLGLRKEKKLSIRNKS